MKCLNCGKEFDIEWQGKIVSIDGDGVCSDKCEKENKEKMHRFCTEVLPSEKKTTAYLLGK